MTDGRGVRVAWLSGGVSSFIAAYVGNPDRIIYISVANQHPDTLRFIADCSRHLAAPVEIIGDLDYGQSVDRVIERRRYIAGPHGAPCTTLLKKCVRQAWERRNAQVGMSYIWGLDASEGHRAERVAQNSEFPCEFPLIERGLTKEACHAMCERLGVRRPAMYDMGYRNNNCIGCVKGGMGYWNRIRRDFPEVFERRARQERQVGASCIKGVYLDELSPTRGRLEDEVIPEYDLFCAGLISPEGSDLDV